MGFNIIVGTATFNGVSVRFFVNREKDLLVVNIDGGDNDGDEIYRGSNEDCPTELQNVHC
jgi:hypothetical protein